MRISDWSSDVCSSDRVTVELGITISLDKLENLRSGLNPASSLKKIPEPMKNLIEGGPVRMVAALTFVMPFRSEEHTSELQSLMRISYAVFCLKKKKIIKIRST